jgi:hypothetical protein
MACAMIPARASPSILMLLDDVNHNSMWVDLTLAWR